MRAVFADTAFFLALINPRDQSHGQAVRGCELYATRSDKNWSLTDCISFVVMRERGLTDALTADRHFQQAGFKALFLD